MCLARIAQISYFIVTYQCTEDFSFSLYFMTVGVFFSLISVPAQDCAVPAQDCHVNSGISSSGESKNDFHFRVPPTPQWRPRVGELV